MLGADLETERRTDLKYKLYRIDLMTDVTINRAKAITKEEVGLSELMISLNIGWKIPICSQVRLRQL